MDVVTLLQDLCLAAVPSLGFALLFHVPRHALWYALVLGGLGHAGRSLLIANGLAIVFATFFAAAGIGFIGVWIGRRYQAHPKVFTVAAIIPMIPGVYAYRSMLSLIEIQRSGYSEMLWAHFVENFTETAFLLAALVCGLALPGLLFYRRRPVV